MTLPFFVRTRFSPFARVALAICALVQLVFALAEALASPLGEWGAIVGRNFAVMVMFVVSECLTFLVWQATLGLLARRGPQRPEGAGTTRAVARVLLFVLLLFPCIIFQYWAYAHLLFESRPFSWFRALNWYFMAAGLSGLGLFLLEWLEAYQLAREQEKRALKRELEAERFRAEALMRRVEPHFLFNALNSIKALAIEKRVEEIPVAVERLAEVYRLILESPVHELAPLSRELCLVESYLQVERIRFDERLSFHIEVASSVDADETAFPPLVLLTLVENAVKHGIAKALTPGEIRLEIFRADGDSERWLCCRILNPGRLALLERPSATDARPGGLALARRRLASWGEPCLSLSEAEGGVACELRLGEAIWNSKRTLS